MNANIRRRKGAETARSHPTGGKSFRAAPRAPRPDVAERPRTARYRAYDRQLEALEAKKASIHVLPYHLVPYMDT